MSQNENCFHHIGKHVPNPGTPVAGRFPEGCRQILFVRVTVLPHLTGLYIAGKFGYTFTAPGLDLAVPAHPRVRQARDSPLEGRWVESRFNNSTHSLCFSRGKPLACLTGFLHGKDNLNAPRGVSPLRWLVRGLLQRIETVILDISNLRILEDRNDET